VRSRWDNIPAMQHARTSILAAICSLVLLACASAQQPSNPPPGVEEALASIRPEAIRAHMRFLADDLLEGRATASRGYDLAARYVETAFEGMGLAPGGTGGSYLQPVPLVKTTTVASECSMAVLRKGRRTELKHGEDYLLSADGLAEVESSLTAPVVFVGFGTTAPEQDHDDYAGVDVRGKLVVVLPDAPTSFPSNQRAFYSRSLYKVENAAAHGAAGVIRMSTPKSELRRPWENQVRHSKSPDFSWADEQGRGHGIYPGIRGLASLSPKAAKDLFAGAPHSLEEVFEAAEAGRPLSFALPVEMSLRTVGRQERAASPNVAAVLPGSDPRLREEYVVLTAHLDHVGVGEPIDGDAIYNGAYDNASGIAVLLEMARAFARLPVAPRRSLVFLAVTGEEEGMQGSDFFARHPTMPGGRIVANINMDMFLMFHSLRDVVAFGAEHSSLGRVVEEAAGRLGIEVSPDPSPEEVIFVRSDHFSFVRQGIPAVMLFNGFKTEGSETAGQEAFRKWMAERYHKPGDDLKQDFDFEAGAQFARLNFLIAWQVAQEEKAPSWNPGDFFGEKYRRKAAGEQ
jgi:Zn-dependent M28 family amino/carboxypeptidase